jgi:hypothetical protein
MKRSGIPHSGKEEVESCKNGRKNQNNAKALFQIGFHQKETGPKIVKQYFKT